MDFNYGTINFQNESYKETKSGGYHIRYKYYVIPLEFEGTLFTHIKDNTINENTFSINNTIENVIEEKQTYFNNITIIFWTIWIIFVGFIDFGYMCLENNYLEDKKKVSDSNENRQKNTTNNTIQHKRNKNKRRDI